MSAARLALSARLTTLDLCIADPVASDGLPNDVVKNTKASMVRGGLAVMTFAIAEAFLRERVAEVLRAFNPGVVSFSELSRELQETVTLDALRGLQFRVRFQSPSARVGWALSQLPPIASAATNVSTLSELSFGSTSSNLGSDDIRSILKAFGVQKSWDSITQIAHRVGLGGIPDYEQEFKALAERRHAAAHDVSSQILYSQLVGAKHSVLGICVPFDLLISHALALHNLGQVPHLTKTMIDHTCISLRVIRPHSIAEKGYREAIERPNGQLHVHRVHASLAAAEVAAVAVARVKRQHTIVLDASGVVEKWITW